ncbi:MAG: hypothetical protein EON89_08750 [Brevundimonas sp.]|nr:MAG: hypothetical protein EON89_08750 [Brevundimonas sp.]
MLVNIPAAVGELFDKITILRIKADRLNDPGKRANVAEELTLLEGVAERVAPSPALNRLIADLQAVNAGLWEVEDAKRAHERLGRFDETFVQLARRVYLENDRRAAIKREINLLTGSAVIEEKSYG